MSGRTEARIIILEAALRWLTIAHKDADPVQIAAATANADKVLQLDLLGAAKTAKEQPA